MEPKAGLVQQLFVTSPNGVSEDQTIGADGLT